MTVSGVDLSFHTAIIQISYRFQFDRLDVKRRDYIYNKLQSAIGNYIAMKIYIVLNFFKYCLSGNVLFYYLKTVCCMLDYVMFDVSRVTYIWLVGLKLK